MDRIGADKQKQENLFEFNLQKSGIEKEQLMGDTSDRYMINIRLGYFLFVGGCHGGGGTTPSPDFQMLNLLIYFCIFPYGVCQNIFDTGIN